MAGDDAADPVRRSLERALGEQYQVLRLLGQGGMGAVYLARDAALERLVAVKVLPLQRSDDVASRERFRREARTAARLTHPNIVPLHGFGEADGMLYLVMGYVQGEPLSARLRGGRPCSHTEVRRIGAEIADALDHAHGRGVVHRDVKPDNILIDDETGRALLADFGIAKARGAGPTVTEAGGVIGTPAFMSPEQARGDDAIDGRSDLYSLGLVLWALLAGRLPFEGKDAGDLLVKRLTQEVPPLQQVRPDVPDDLAAAVMRCLARDREARWRDARALREAIAPTGLDEEQLPEPLDGIDGLLPKLLPIGLVFLLSAWHLRVCALTAQEPNLSGALLAVVLGSILIYQLPWLSSAVVLARRRGFSWPTIGGALLRQPIGWRPFWYPAPLRRSWDVWDRLPLPFRVYRGALTLFAASGLALAPVAMLTMGRIAQAELAFADLPPLPVPAMLVRAMLALWLLLALVVAGCLALGARQVLALGYDIYTRRLVASALMAGASSQRPLWRKPEVARALLPIERAQRPAEPELPRDYASAIARAGGAVAEAEGLVAELARLDADLHALAADADPEETARVETRLAALGETVAGEGEERRQRRHLLREQLELAARVEARLAELRADRAERLAALRSLWRAALSPTAPDSATATRTAPRS